MNAEENPTGPAPAGANNDTPDAKPRRPRSGLNKAEIQELTTAEEIIAVARRPAHLAVLTEREITADYLTTVGNSIQVARTCGARITQNDTGGESATIDEREAQTKLVTAMRCVQASAKQKFARKQPEKLDDFAVGRKIDASRPVLEEFSAQFLEKLNTERPPGVDTAFVTKLTAARAEYMLAGTTQGAKKSAASAERDARRALVQSIRDARLEIQFAADAAWPPGQPGHAAIRREFGLPPHRFFSARRKKAA